jgi:hypothetical protein
VKATSHDKRKHDSQTLCQAHAKPRPRQPGNVPRNLMEDQGIPRLWTNDKADRVGISESDEKLLEAMQLPRSPSQRWRGAAHASQHGPKDLRMRNRCGFAS